MINTNNNSKTTNAARGGSNQAGTNAAQAQNRSQTQDGAQPITASYLKVLTVEEYEGPGGKAARRWTQIGVAFPHKDGAGLNVELRCLPLNGRLVILPPDEDDGTSR